jgi:hypothetical protein
VLVELTAFQNPLQLGRYLFVGQIPAGAPDRAMQVSRSVITDMRPVVL